ncbi:hypothetical protein F5X96DRAFT_669698 [Biscogniauxia mediterranea]|nr:hypothetical protein F5X96DRAFT_669698 [Biscogniauxia mediterranea]
MAPYEYSQNSYFGYSQVPRAALTGPTTTPLPMTLRDMPAACCPNPPRAVRWHSSFTYVLELRGPSKHAIIKDDWAFMRSFMEEERGYNAEQHESEAADDGSYQPESRTHRNRSGSASSAGPIQTPPSTSQGGSTGRSVYDEKYVVVVKSREYLEFQAQTFLEEVGDEEYDDHEEGHAMEIVRDLLAEDSEGAEDYYDDDLVLGDDMIWI